MARTAARIAWILALLVGAAASPCAATDAADRFIPMPVERGDGSIITASVIRATAPKSPIVLMLQGSSCAAERDGFASLTRPWRGRFALLFIPKPGGREDGSCGPDYLSRNTISQRLADIETVVGRLRRQPWWDHRLYVIGGSEGGLMAGLTAAHVPETQRTAILSYGGDLTMGEWWPEAAYAAVLKQTGSAEKAAAEREETRAVFERARRQPDSTETYDGDTNTLKWWASIIDLRLLPALLTVRKPNLLVHGSADPYAPVEGARGVERAFRAAGKSNLTYRELAGLDHAYGDDKGGSHLEEVLNDSLAWLLGPPERTPRRARPGRSD